MQVVCLLSKRLGFAPRKHQGLSSPPTLTAKHECLQWAELPAVSTFPLGMGKRCSRVSLSIPLPTIGRVCYACYIPSQLLLWPDSRQSVNIPTYPPPPSPSVHSPAPSPEALHPCQRTNRDSGQVGCWAAGPRSPTDTAAFVNISSEGDDGDCSSKI